MPSRRGDNSGVRQGVKAVRSGSNKMGDWGKVGSKTHGKSYRGGQSNKSRHYQSKPSKPRKLEDSPFAALAALKSGSDTKE